MEFFHIFHDFPVFYGVPTGLAGIILLKTDGCLRQKKNPGREDPGMNAFRFRQATEFRSSRQKTSVNRATVSMIPMTMR